MKKIILIMLILLTLFGCSREQKRLTIPQDLSYLDGVISYSSVKDAKGYILLINNEEFEVTETTYNIEEIGTYTVRVKAIAEGFLDSFYSNAISFTISSPLDDVRFNYSIHSSFDLVIKQTIFNMDIDTITLNEENIDLVNFVIESKSIAIKSTYLSSLEPGLYDFTFNLSNDSFIATINILDTEKPYMISYNESILDPNNNLVFVYELFGGTIEELSGNEMTESDFEINGNTLTVFKDYVNSQFAESRETLILGYTLHAGNDVVIGYIFINRTT